MSQFPSLFSRRSDSSRNEIERIQRQMNTLFDRFWGGGESPFDVASDWFPQTAGFSPLADFEETEKDYMVALDVPGLKKENLKIELRDNVLTVSGERNDFQESGKKGRNYRSERIQGAFTRSFHLPAPIRAEEAQAHCADGVLKITIPKAEPAKVQSIPIRDQKLEQRPIEPKKQTH